MDNLTVVLTGLATGSLTVPVVSWIINSTPEQYFSTKNTKRLLAIALSFILSTGAQLALTYNSGTIPVNYTEWFEVLYPVWTGAYLASQVILSSWKTFRVK